MRSAVQLANELPRERGEEGVRRNRALRRERLDATLSGYFRSQGENFKRGGSQTRELLSKVG